MPRTLASLLLISCCAACGSSIGVSPETADSGTRDAGINDAGSDAGSGDAGSPDAGPDGGTIPLAGCPSALIHPLGDCYAVTPAATGADSSGDNASVASEALTPAPGVALRHQLVLFLNGSGGHPGPTASADVNLYNTAASLGYHVIALSYRSTAEVATLCSLSDPCFFPTRETLITGVVQSGSASGVSDMRLDEGITDRLFLLLRYLSAAAPADDWGQFLKGTDAAAVPAAQIDWTKLVATGHSQGGGHAAAIGKLFAVARVIQFSSTCDELSPMTPASWTDGAVGTWASNPALFYGLGVQTTFTSGGVPSGGDTVCPAHAAVWANLGMSAARSDDGASTCDGANAPHNATVYCADNAPFWQAELE